MSAINYSKFVDNNTNKSTLAVCPTSIISHNICLFPNECQDYMMTFLCQNVHPMRSAKANYNDPHNRPNITQILNNLLHTVSILHYHCVF